MMDKQYDFIGKAVIKPFPSSNRKNVGNLLLSTHILKILQPKYDTDYPDMLVLNSSSKNMSIHSDSHQQYTQPDEPDQRDIFHDNCDVFWGDRLTHHGMNERIIT